MYRCKASVSDLQQCLQGYQGASCLFYRFCILLVISRNQACHIDCRVYYYHDCNNDDIYYPSCKANNNFHSRGFQSNHSTSTETSYVGYTTTVGTTTSTSVTTTVVSSVKYSCEPSVYPPPRAKEKRSASNTNKKQTIRLPPCLKAFERTLGSACKCLSIRAPTRTTTSLLASSVTRTVTSTYLRTEFDTATTTTTIISVITARTTTTVTTSTVCVTASASTTSTSTNTTFTSTTTYTIFPTFGLLPTASAIANEGAYAEIAEHGPGGNPVYGAVLSTRNNRISSVTTQLFQLSSECHLTALGGQYTGTRMFTENCCLRAGTSFAFFRLSPPGQIAGVGTQPWICRIVNTNELDCDFVYGANEWSQQRAEGGPYWKVGKPGAYQGFTSSGGPDQLLGFPRVVPYSDVCGQPGNNQTCDIT
ncbi:hypothetical protein CBER1_00068 [Cercospora berteroae]|uniref:Uncharacterized protein n=1 Tax=Cercospora berteroae TaxID=357750 RepID=A0A2S6CDC1_9PEZI|nr:hypothetical protein CBER1_00068 [Cercospora berteroae]